MNPRGRVLPDHIAPMIATLDHRGPDERGTCHFPRVAMANARLSIIDLSGGHQPITNEDDTVYVVYNGELYNAPELREELIGKGHRFKTRSDTEVLVHLYEEEGVDFLKRLNGMFALSIYDTRDNSVLIARDRFGVKPLVILQHDGVLGWASEIKALRVLPEFDGTLSPEGLSTFLGLMYIPDPWTAYAHVRKLRPGHYLHLVGDDVREGTFWDYDFGTKDRISLDEAANDMAELLRQSVGRQMLSDVPVGVLLSGGLDSRSVLAAAAERAPGLPSFTISFDDALFDESDAASAWAKAFGSDHHRMLFTEEDFCDRLLGRQAHQDEPYGLWCQVAVESLADYIHRNDIKVVLSGEGGDELFLGYPTVHAATVMQLYQRLLPGFVRRGVVRPLVNRLPAGRGRIPLAFVAQSFAASDYDDIIRTFFGFKEVLRYETWPDLLTPEALAMVGAIDPAIAMTQYRDRIEGWSVVDGLSYLDNKVFLPGSSFTGNDNAYMAHSVESRVPMMDNDLVDHAMHLPVEVRFDRRKLKVVPRHALPRHFPPPPSLAGQRYRKAGFEVPTQSWLLTDGPFRALADKILSRERIAATGFFRPDKVRAIFEEQCAGSANHERVLQVIMSLVLFLDSSYQLD